MWVMGAVWESCPLKFSRQGVINWDISLGKTTRPIGRCCVSDSHGGVLGLVVAVACGTARIVVWLLDLRGGEHTWTWKTYLVSNQGTPDRRST